MLFPRNIPLILLLFSSISGISYRYLCYLLRYLGLYLFLFVYKDIHYASCSHASIHTLVSICHTVSYKSDMRLAFLLMDFSALYPVIVSLFSYAVQPLSLVFSHWHPALLRRITTPSPAHKHCSLEYLLARLLHTPLVHAIPLILTFTFTLVYTLYSHTHILLQ